jgi:glutathione S-transferase
MPVGATDLIVHQYNLAPAFSVKARLMLGFKNARWFACDHSTILPKPELLALTGGYRQIPVAQIGADIYCGSELLLDILEIRIAEPALARLSGPGLGRGFAYWAEDTLFWLMVQIVCGSDFAGASDEAFNADRRRMLPGLYDIAAMKEALPANIQLLRAHLDLVERQLADGRAFLLGDLPDIADISLYFPIHFLGFCRNGNERIPEDYPALSAWMQRVAAIGHGQREEVERADAIAIARAASPTVTPCSTVKEGPQPGDKVTVKWAAWSPVDLEGELVEVHARRVAVRWTSPEADDLVVHFPRSAATLVG